MVLFPFLTSVTMAMSRQRRLHLAVSWKCSEWGAPCISLCEALALYILALSSPSSSLFSSSSASSSFSSASASYRRRHPRRPHRRHEHHHHHHDRRYQHPIITLNCLHRCFRTRLIIILIIITPYSPFSSSSSFLFTVIATIIVILNNIWGRRWCNFYEEIGSDRVR